MNISSSLYDHGRTHLPLEAWPGSETKTLRILDLPEMFSHRNGMIMHTAAEALFGLSVSPLLKSGQIDNCEHACGHSNVFTSLISSIDTQDQIIFAPFFIVFC
jgi:hypothetical protein